MHSLDTDNTRATPAVGVECFRVCVCPCMCALYTSLHTGCVSSVYKVFWYIDDTHVCAQYMCVTQYTAPVCALWAQCMSAGSSLAYEACVQTMYTCCHDELYLCVHPVCREGAHTLVCLLHADTENFIQRTRV